MSMPTQIIKIPLYQIADIQLDIHSIKIWSDNECFRMFSFQHVHSAHAYTHTHTCTLSNRMKEEREQCNRQGNMSIHTD